MTNKTCTFSMIKPNAVEAGLAGKILSEIEENGFKIIKLRKIKMTKEQAAEFYKDLSQCQFYEDLCSFMSSGEIYIMVLEKENAVSDFRELIGATDPLQARIGTLRKKYGENKGKNSIHGSDSDQSANREINFFKF